MHVTVEVEKKRKFGKTEKLGNGSKCPKMVVNPK